MRTRRLPAALTALAATAVVLAGCSSSSGGGGDDDAERESPLAVYLNAVYGGNLSPEEQQAQDADRNRQVEEMVASCMQDDGFEYVPSTDGGGVVFSGDENGYEPDDRDWVSQYGYGAINYPGDDVRADTGEEYVDPNGDYVASLSESEQTAFHEALNGPQPTEDEQAAMEDGSYEYDWTTAGCYGAAQHEVFETEDLSESAEFAPLFDQINALYENSGNSPELVALDGEWAECMDAAGHPGFTAQVDAQNSIYDALNELYESLPVDAEGNSSGEPDQAARDAIAEKEIPLALADLDCREETDYRERAEDIQFELEEQFVADHKTELDALLAAAEQD